MKVTGCLDPVPGCLDLVPWLLSEGYHLPGFSSWMPDEESMVAWTLLHGFLKELGCLY